MSNHVNVRDFRDSLATALMKNEGCSSKYDGKNRCVAHQVDTTEDGLCLEMISLANDALVGVKIELRKLAEPQTLRGIEFTITKVNPVDAILSNAKKILDVAKVIYNTSDSSMDENEEHIPWKNISRERQVSLIRRAHTVVAEVFAD